MKKDNWFLENRSFRWYDGLFISIYLVLIVLTIAMIIFTKIN